MGAETNSAAQVGKKTRAGMIWTVGTGLTTRGIGLVTTLLLTAYMTPQQAGSVNVALTVVTTVSVLTTVGLGQFLVSQRNPSPRVAWNAMVFHLGLGILAFGATLVFSTELAEMFEATTGARFIPLLLLSNLLERSTYVPERVLVAQMRFRHLSMMRSAGELSYCVGALAGAMLGYGPWCIVSGNLLRQLVRVALLLRYAPPREWFVPEPPDREVLRMLLRFGLPIMVASVAAFATRRWDNLMVAHYYGTAVLGLYNLAYNLAEVPAVQIAEMTADVLAPSFARLEAKDRRQAAVDMVGTLALSVFPLAVGMAVVAPTIAEALPRRWEGIAPILMGLATLSLSRPVVIVLGVYLQALRKPVPSAALQITQVGLLMGALFIAGRVFPHRPVAACLAVSASFLVGSVLAIWIMRMVDEVPAWPMVRAHLLPVPALLLMVITVLGAGSLIARAGGLELPPLVRLTMLILAGGVGYVVGLLIFVPAQVRRLITTLRGMRR